MGYPRPVAAVLDALHFSGARREGLLRLSEAEWRQALDYCDRNQLTLHLLRATSAEPLPPWVRERLAGNAAASRDRFAQLAALYRDVAQRLDAAGLKHVVLKGFTHWPQLAPDPALRTQYDLDLYLPQPDAVKACAIVRELGYEPLAGQERFPTDHLPVMIRKTGWQWRGDFFDRDLPFAIELHFRFWDPHTERFGPTVCPDFWEQRESRTWQDLRFQSLAPRHIVSYACMHALRHLLRGDCRPNHLYEIAWFLEQGGTVEGATTVELICCALAHKLFGCPRPPDVDGLPQDSKHWVERYAHAPFEAAFHPNKDELWLHLSLVEGTANQLAVIRRRLFPGTLPGPVDAVHVKELTLRLHVRRKLRYIAFLGRRLWHHARALLPVVLHGARWWFAKQEVPSMFWWFFATSLVFNLGLFLFFLLYNLHLLDMGFREDFVGLVSGTFSAGSIAGSLLVGWIATRFGLRTALLGGIAGSAVVAAARVLLPTQSLLLAASFAGGVCTAAWAVCLAPSVAQLSTERNRTFVFSLTMSTAIGLGVIAGLTTGKLVSLFGSKQAVLLVGCLVTLLALVPASRLRFAMKPAEKKSYMLNPFLKRYLFAILLWNLATSTFNPFFNVYFSRQLNLDVQQIGWIFSASQFMQVAAMLAAPVLLRGLGLVGGIAAAQVGTAVALLAMAVVPAAAGYVYVAYTSLQFMTEPGMYSMLMSRVDEGHRSGASAMNFFVAFSCHALAAAFAGQVIAKAGYPPALIAAACLALLAALSFQFLLRD